MFPIYSGYTTTGTPHKRDIGFLFCPYAHRAFMDWIPVRKYFWPETRLELNVHKSDMISIFRCTNKILPLYHYNALTHHFMPFLYSISM